MDCRDAFKNSPARDYGIPEVTVVLPWHCHQFSYWLILQRLHCSHIHFLTISFPSTYVITQLPFYACVQDGLQRRRPERSLNETYWRSSNSLKYCKLGTYTFKKGRTSFQSLIDRNNRPDRLHSHRTSAIIHQSSILSLRIKAAYVTVWRGVTTGWSTLSCA
jgi:hypothetical protein